MEQKYALIKMIENNMTYENINFKTAQISKFWVQFAKEEIKNRPKSWNDLQNFIVLAQSLEMENIFL